MVSTAKSNRNSSLIDWERVVDLRRKIYAASERSQRKLFVGTTTLLAAVFRDNPQSTRIESFIRRRIIG